MYEIEEYVEPWIEYVTDQNTIGRNKEFEEKGRRPTISMGILPKISALIQHCWHQNPKSRCSNHEALSSLKEFAPTIR